MGEEFPWSDPEVLTRLSRQPVGENLAERVARRLVADDGQKGIWNAHRDYCGHGLISLESRIALIKVHDGMARDGTVLHAWDREAEFARWLSRQSDYSLSGSDPGETILHTSEPFLLNNQRLTRARLEEYASGQEILPAFRDYLTILETAFLFLVEEFGFEKAPPEMVGRECVVAFTMLPRSAITVISEPFCTPHLLLSLNSPESGRSFSNQPLVGLAKLRAPEWRAPRFGRDAPGEESNLYDCFGQYEAVLRRHFADVLVPEPVAVSAQTASLSDGSGETGHSPNASQSRFRLYGVGLVLASLLVMVLELRYFFAHGAPEATNSARGNWGLLILMGLPWVVCVAGALQALSGVDIRRYSSVFSSASLSRRLGISLVALLAALLATGVAFMLA